MFQMHRLQTYVIATYDDDDVCIQVQSAWKAEAAIACAYRKMYSTS